MRNGLALSILAGIVLVSLGCGKSGRPDPAPAGEQATIPSSPEAAGSAVRTIVFVDQEECCDCTRERQAATWRNLQEAIAGNGLKIAVETVHFDSQAEAAAMYLDLKPIMVFPGLYFLDDKEELVEQLQGELSVEQIKAVVQ